MILNTLLRTQKAYYLVYYLLSREERDIFETKTEIRWG